jgi:hypothetical protein
MKLRYLKAICAAILLFTTSVALAQPYRQLTPNDFTGDVPQNSGFYIAHTSCNVTMNYQIQKYRSNYQLTFNIRLMLNRDRSWINRKVINTPETMSEVLRHEQGHYQIAYLMQQEMISALNQYHYTGDYQRQTDAIFKRIDDKYREMNSAYEQDTQHMQNRKQQAEWVNFLNREVAQASSLAMNE